MDASGTEEQTVFFLSFFTGCCSTQLEHSQFPDPGSNRGPLQGKLRALPTGPPGNPPVSYFNKYFINQEKKKKSHLTKKKKNEKVFGREPRVWPGSCMLSGLVCVWTAGSKKHHSEPGQTFPQGGHTDARQVHGKVLHITSHRRNANQNHSETPSHTCQSSQPQKVHK